MMSQQILRRKGDIMHREPPTEQMLTVRDVADCFSVSIRTIWRWAYIGKIPRPIRLGFHVARWRASEIQRHLDKQPPLPRRRS